MNKTQPRSSRTLTLITPSAQSTVGAREARTDLSGGSFPEEVPALQEDETFAQRARRGEASRQRTVCAKAPGRNWLGAARGESVARW